MKYYVILSKTILGSVKKVSPKLTDKYKVAYSSLQRSVDKQVKVLNCLKAISYDKCFDKSLIYYAEEETVDKINIYRNNGTGKLPTLVKIISIKQISI